MNLKKLIIPGLLLIGIVVCLVWFVNHKSLDGGSKTNTPKLAVKAKTENAEDKVLANLEKNVPEIDAFQQQIDKSSHGQVKLMMKFDGVPDQKSTDPYHDYYIVYVGEDHTDHTVRWNTFYVKSDLSQILVEDIMSGDIVTLEQWRKLKDEK